MRQPWPCCVQRGFVQSLHTILCSALCRRTLCENADRSLVNSHTPHVRVPVSRWVQSRHTTARSLLWCSALSENDALSLISWHTVHSKLQLPHRHVCNSMGDRGYRTPGPGRNRVKLHRSSPAHAISRQQRHVAHPVTVQRGLVQSSHTSGRRARSLYQFRINCCENSVSFSWPHA